MGGKCDCCRKDDESESSLQEEIPNVLQILTSPRTLTCECGRSDFDDETMRQVLNSPRTLTEEQLARMRSYQAPGSSKVDQKEDHEKIKQKNTPIHSLIAASEGVSSVDPHLQEGWVQESLGPQNNL